MRIFLYEFITGGGMFSVNPNEVPSGSLLREGTAMFESLAADFARIPDVEVIALRDERLCVPEHTGTSYHLVRCAEEESRQFDAMVTAADWTLVIAPEFDNILLNKTGRVEAIGGRSLGPSSHIVALGTNKNRTVAHFAKQDVPTVRGVGFGLGSSVPKTFRFPAILKPADGAGSQNITQVDSFDKLPNLMDGEFRLEEFHPGTPASVAILSGPKQHIALPACQQTLSENGSFQYFGGTVPLDRSLRERAERLAMKGAQTLPDPLGYIGFDIILGQTPDSDVIIEMNPRMTTSYVGLRELARGNLAAAMIDIAEGKTPDLCFDTGPVRFLADGMILCNRMTKH
jgi:tyramine---L-glutamate ligase